MIKEPKTMAELHKLREEHYEATRKKKLNLIVEEIASQSREIIKKYNLGVKRFEIMKEIPVVSDK